MGWNNLWKLKRFTHSEDKHVETKNKDGSGSFLILFEIGKNHWEMSVASEEWKRNIKAQFIKYVSH